MTQALGSCSEALVRHMADFLDDKSLGCFSVTSDSNSKIVERLWKMRYEKVGKTNSFFGLLPRNTDFRQSYATAFSFEQVVTVFGKRVKSPDERFIITNPRDLDAVSENNFQIINFVADYRGDTYIPVTYYKIISPTEQGTRDGEQEMVRNKITTVPVCVSIIRNLELPDTVAMCLAMNPSKHVAGFGVRTPAAHRMSRLETTVKRLFQLRLEIMGSWGQA